jgi:uncharacterized cupin superfamily protein
MEPERVPGLILAGKGRPLRIGNDLLLVKALTGLDDGVAVLETIAEPGGPAPLDHVHHTYDEVFYVLEGEFLFRLDDHLVRAGPGAVVSVPRGTPHTFKNCGETNGRILIIGAPGRAAQMLADIGTMVASPGPLPPDALERLYAGHDTVLVPPLLAEGESA